MNNTIHLLKEALEYTRKESHKKNKASQKQQGMSEAYDIMGEKIYFALSEYKRQRKINIRNNFMVGVYTVSLSLYSLYTYFG